MSDPRHYPVVVFVSGPAGSGKTTLSERLCRSLSLPFIDFDSICEPFLGVLQEKDGVAIRDSTFTRQYREVCYAAFFDVVFENVEMGLNVLATAPLSSELEETGFFPRIKQHYGVDFISFDAYIDISEEDLLCNIKARGSERDRQKLSNWDDFFMQSKNQRRQWSPDHSMCVRYRAGDFDEEDCSFLEKAIRLQI